MPIIFTKQIAKYITVAVWQIAETEEYFNHALQLFPEDRAKIGNMKLQNVRLQKLACRAALAELLETHEIGITYSETGQPQLKGEHISFSHTEKTVAVAVANVPVGIDIEVMKPRILNLYSRFMSQQEIAACDINHLTDLYYFWCAKEAMYKWFAKKKLDFIEDLQVDKNNNVGIICDKYHVQLTPIIIDNQLLVTCHKETLFSVKNNITQ
jgi:phosphopantetheinyl transferase